jgi:uncharacterized Zn-finger protein
MPVDASQQVGLNLLRKTGIADHRPILRGACGARSRNRQCRKEPLGDGVGGALGHPRVWYDMSEDDHVACKYCDRVFALKGGSRDPAH